MANIRKSADGRKRARTIEYIDSQVDIKDDEQSQKNTHLGQRIHANIDISMSFIDEINPIESAFRQAVQQPLPLMPKIKRRDSDRSFLHRQTSDMSLNRFINETNKTTTTELKGREHILRVMKATTNKPSMEIKNHKFIQEMLAKRQEQQEVSAPVSDFALKYGLVDHNGKKSKSRISSELVADMEHQVVSLKSTLNRRQSSVDITSPLLKVVKLESTCNQLLCYCQYVTNREDLVLFLDPNDDQSKMLAVNDEIRVGGESKLDMNLTNLGSVTLGINSIRKESNNNNNEPDNRIETVHTFDFNCSCNRCNSNESKEQDAEETFDLRSTFSTDTKASQHTYSIETVYDSFTFALMSKRKFDLRVTIIIFDPDPTTNRYIFVVRDGIGNCLQILLTNINELQIEIQTKEYIFHQIEFIERIESPKESNRWPYEDYVPPKKLFCFRSTNNQVSIL